MMKEQEMTPDEWHRLTTASREAELVRRYEAGEPLTHADKAEARRIIRRRKAEQPTG